MGDGQKCGLLYTPNHRHAGTTNKHEPLRVERVTIQVLVATPSRVNGQSGVAKNFDLSLLSEREQGILDLAIDGLTDQQIGHRLGITPSTVNSYWVRIRGKLGHLSRTELVSRIVQQRAEAESETFGARMKTLEREIEVLRRSARNSDDANLLRIALDANPEAFVVFDDHGKVLIANRRFEELFNLPLDSAAGMTFERLFSVGGRSFFEVMYSDRKDPGLDYPIFGNAHPASQFRLYLITGSGEFDGRKILSCVVRPFAEELELRRRRAEFVIAQVS